MKPGIAVLVTSVLIAGAIVFGKNDEPTAANVRIENGIQIIEITAKGRYSPDVSVAQADMPTIVRMKTMGTYDCSAALQIPSIGYKKMLPASGSTDIELPPQEAGTTLRGTCAMGMYGFAIEFD